MPQNKRQIPMKFWLASALAVSASFVLPANEALADKKYVPFWMKNCKPQDSSSKSTSTVKTPAKPGKISQMKPAPKKGITLVEDPNSSLWADIKVADSIHYPVPLFRGTRTKIMRTTDGNYYSTSMYGKQVILETRDPPEVVFRWYRDQLPRAGYALNERYPTTELFGQAMMVRGDSHTDQAMVSINPQYDNLGALTHIQVSIAPKHNVYP